MIGRLALAGLALVLGAVASLAVLAALAVRVPTLAVPEREALAIGPATMIEPGLRRLEGATIRLRGGRIEAIDTAGRTDAAADPRFAGLVVLPGLVDVHVHHAPGAERLMGTLFLLHGVTTVRDVGSPWGLALAVGEGTARGRWPGPRVLACGPFVDGEPALWPGSLRMTTPEDVPRIVDTLADEGASCMKLYNEVPPAIVPEAVAAARAAGLQPVAHVKDPAAIDAFRGAEIQHLMPFAPEALEGLGATMPEEVVATTRRLGLANTPTQISFAAAAGRTPVLPADPAARARLEAAIPRFVRERLWSPAHNPLIERMYGDPVLLPARVAHAAATIAALDAADTPLFLGTDAPNPGVVPGLALHQEIELWVRAGIARERVWQRATAGAGAMLGLPGAAPLGRLVPGAPADLLVFSHDPLRGGDATARLVAVVADGRLYERAALEASLEAIAGHAPLRLLDALALRLLDALASDRLTPKG